MRKRGRQEKRGGEIKEGEMKRGAHLVGLCVAEVRKHMCHLRERRESERGDVCCCVIVLLCYCVIVLLCYCVIVLLCLGVFTWEQSG